MCQLLRFGAGNFFDLLKVVKFLNLSYMKAFRV